MVSMAQTALKEIERLQKDIVENNKIHERLTRDAYAGELL